MKGLSQSLMEYILLLAIVLILGAVIYVVLTSAGIIEFGVIKSTSRAQSEAYWIAQDVGIQPNYRISSMGIAELTLKNNKQFRIEILGVTLNEKGASAPALLALGRGETAELNVTGFDRCPAGQVYGYRVSIKYRDIGSNRTFTVSGGSANPLVGNCESD